MLIVLPTILLRREQVLKDIEKGRINGGEVFRQQRKKEGVGHEDIKENGVL